MTLEDALRHMKQRFQYWQLKRDRETYLNFNKLDTKGTESIFLSTFKLQNESHKTRLFFSLNLNKMHLKYLYHNSQ